MLWLGGDHSITLPLLRQYRRHLGRPLALIHFDAHCDTWVDHMGEPSGHGTWVYEALQEGLVDAACVAQIGIRSAGERAARDYVQQQGGQIFTGRALRGLVSPAQLAGVTGAIRERLAAHGHPPLYLSLDIDCLDPAHAPGTGTPEPGGLSTAQLFTLLEELSDLAFVGMDCVEVSPPYDHAELTSQAAAQAVWTYLCGQLARERRAHCRADDGGFRNRRRADAVRPVFLGQARSDLEHPAALLGSNILAKAEHARIIGHRLVNREVERLSHGDLGHQAVSSSTSL
jgi:agmatinase